MTQSRPRLSILRTFMIASAIVFSAAFVQSGQSVSAQPAPVPTPAPAPDPATPTPTPPPAGGSGECAGVKTSFISCRGEGSEAVGGVLKQIILIVSVGVGIVAVGGIVYGALLYASARDSQAQTEKAITIITSVVIGLLLYVFMTAIINWLIPGGVFS